MAATLPYNYDRSASEFEDDPNGQPANTSTTGAPGAPTLYGSNDPKRTTASDVAPQPSGAGYSTQQSGAVAPPRTFAQMQAEGYARPPMPTDTTTQIAPPAVSPTTAAPQPIQPGDMPANTYSSGGKQGFDADYAGVMAGGDPDQQKLYQYMQNNGLGGQDVQFGADGSAMYGSGPNAGHVIPGYGANANLADLTRAAAAPNAPVATNPQQAPSVTPAYLQNGVLSNTPTPTGAMGASSIPGSAASAPGAGYTAANTPGIASGATGGTSDLVSLLLGGANGRTAASPLTDATQAAALKMLGSPSPYGTKEVQDAYNWMGGQIDDEYAQRQKALDDEMARRGLGVSTNKAGRLNDLNIGKRSAKESLAENLGQNLAQTQGQYQANAINAANGVGQTQNANQLSWVDRLMGFGQNAFNNDLATNALNQQAQNSWQDYILRLLGLGYGG